MTSGNNLFLGRFVVTAGLRGLTGQRYLVSFYNNIDGKEFRMAFRLVEPSEFAEVREFVAKCLPSFSADQVRIFQNQVCLELEALEKKPKTVCIVLVLEPGLPETKEQKFQMNACEPAQQAPFEEDYVGNFDVTAYFDGRRMGRVLFYEFDGTGDSVVAEKNCFFSIDQEAQARGFVDGCLAKFGLSDKELEHYRDRVWRCVVNVCSERGPYDDGELQTDPRELMVRKAKFPKPKSLGAFLKEFFGKWLTW
jgi:hypothetical protein